MTTHVSTFYSFKGGVGRTLLLANVGVSLARSHQRTLLWDLDLEAPGMHHIEGLKPRKPPASGFLKWLLDWQQAGAPSPVEGHLLESFLGLPYAVSDIPGLFVLPAHGARENFTRLYQDIDWHAFTVAHPERGVALFQQLLDGLAARQEYDHVLVDSRTGITDLGGLLTAVLPHATVLVGNYSAQNTAGLLNVYRALQPAVAGKVPERRYGRLRRLLVASPVPLHETREAVEARRAVWNSQFEIPPDETRVEIPFLGRLLVGEELLVETDPRLPTAEAYRNVAERLTELREERIQEEEAARLGDQLYPEHAQARRVSGPEGTLAPELVFEQRVEKLLRLLGYSVNRLEGQDRGADLQAQRKSGLQQERYLIECKQLRRPLSLTEARALTERLLLMGNRFPESTLMVVASAFSPAALDFLRQQRVLTFTLKDLERELFDFKPYLSRLRRSFEESTLARTYISPRLRSLHEEGTSSDGLTRGRAWARGEGSRLWLVVGEAGAGKTSFARRLAYELATAAEEDADSPAPLLIPLKDFSKVGSLEALLQEHLAVTVGWREDPAILLHLLAAGRMVLLLDGLDELGEANPLLMEENLRQLARPAAAEPEDPRGNRVLITGRAHYFREVRKDKRVGMWTLELPLGRIASGLGAEVDELAGWNQQQLREFLIRSLGEERAVRWDGLLSKLEARPELISRPLLLEMLLSMAPELSSQDRALTLGTLFQRFTDHWLRAMAQAPVSELEEGGLERLAYELRRLPQGRIHRSKLQGLLEAGSTKPAAIQPNLESALALLPFITRDASGYYQFTFKLFEDFFYARHLLRAARARTLAGALDAPPLTADCAAFLSDLASREDVQLLHQGVHQVLSSSYVRQVTEHALQLAYEWSCGVAGGAGPRSQSEMMQLVPSEACLQGANLRGARLAFAWLEGALLEGACLDGVDLTGANFRGSHGRGLQLRGSILDGTDFTQAQLQGADLSGSTAFHRGPLFEKADLRGSRLSGTAWLLPMLRKAFLDSENLALARWRADFADAEDEAVVMPGRTGVGRDVAVSPDGTLIVVSGSQQPIVWELGSGRPLITLIGHEKYVIRVAFSPDGMRIASASADGTAGVWDAATGKLLRRFEGHQSRVTQAVFSPDGRMLASCSRDGTARLWSVDTGECVRVIQAHADWVSSVAFSPDGALLATGSKDGTICIWRVSTGAQFRQLSVHQHVTALTFNPLGPLQLIIGSKSSGLKVWDVAQQKLTRELTIGDEDTWRVVCDGEYLAASTSLSRVVMWDAQTGQLEGDMRLTGSGVGLALVPGRRGQIAAATTRGIWLCRPGMPVARMQRVRSTVGYCGCFLPGGQVVLGGEKGGARVWNTRTGTAGLILAVGQGAVESLAASSGGAELVTASTDGVVRLWETESGKLLNVVTRHVGSCRLALSTDGHLAVADANGASIWELRSNRPRVLFSLTALEGQVWDLAFSRDGRSLVTTSGDGIVRLWDAQTGVALRAWDSHSDKAAAIAFSPSAPLLASAGADDKVCLWHFPTGELAFELKGHDQPIMSIVFSPDGSLLLSGSRDCTVRVWSMREQRQVAMLEGHEAGVSAVAFSTEGDRVVTVSLGGTARLWDTRTWRLLATFVWLEPGWATLAGSYAMTSPHADTDRLAVRAGALCAPLTLFKDVCVRPDHVQAALAGKPVPPLKLQLDAASRVAGARQDS